MSSSIRGSWRTVSSRWGTTSPLTCTSAAMANRSSLRLAGCVCPPARLPPPTRRMRARRARRTAAMPTPLVSSDLCSDPPPTSRPLRSGTTSLPPSWRLLRRRSRRVKAELPPWLQANQWPFLRCSSTRTFFWVRCSRRTLLRASRRSIVRTPVARLTFRCASPSLTPENFQSMMLSLSNFVPTAVVCRMHLLPCGDWLGGRRISNCCSLASTSARSDTSTLEATASLIAPTSKPSTATRPRSRRSP
mmetsp:Transcript_8340/g.22999  ORF Transcript_8340/g.22999 Transcript_8340/m.22999 type:complete len:247 (-) Transcript_8340:957-1697(-)